MTDTKKPIEDLDRPLIIPDMPPKMREIFLDVCEKHVIHPLDLAGSRPVLKYVQARRDFIVQCKQKYDYPFYYISKILKKDHTTIMHAYHQWLQGAKIDPYKINQNDHHKYLDGKITKRQRYLLELQDQGFSQEEMMSIAKIGIGAVRNNLCAANDKLAALVTMKKIKEYRQSIARRNEALDRGIFAYLQKETPQAGEPAALS